MSHYTARVKWQFDGAEFSKHQYSRTHHWHFDGGCTVAASASTQIVPEPWSKPGHVDPEEAFVASLASCHMLFFLDLAARAGYEVSSYEDNAEGTLSKNSAGAMAMTEVELRPQVVFAGEQTPPADEILKIHEQAHKLCFIANSVNTRIKISPR